jgi:hypothetical protein
VSAFSHEPEERKNPTTPPELKHALGPTQPFLPRLAEVTREELQVGTRYRPDCCIAATRALIDVLDYFRLTARPLSVIATVFNPVMCERIERDAMPTLEEAERDWFPHGCYSLAVGLGDPEPGKWPGHLVLNLEDRVLIDLTLDQANRPQHGILLPMPILAPLSPGFLTEEGQMVGLVNGCRVVYEARPFDRSFERSKDWTHRKRLDAVVGAAIRRLKAEF